MNFFATVAFLAVFAAAQAGILQGPSTRTTLVGPEGSVISSVAPGGTVITKSYPGYAGYAAAPLAYSAPVGYASHVYTAPLAYSAYSTPYAYSVPVVAHGAVNTIVAGPSGTVTASRSLTAADVAYA